MHTLIAIGVIVYIIVKIVMNYWWLLLIIIGVLALLVYLVTAAEKRQGISRTNTFNPRSNFIGNVISASDWLEEKPKKKHSGKCDGDCANCPPHYGYRYGRWYYGRDHIRGCQFGGNRGGGQYN